jgi:hypothetical protein
LEQRRFDESDISRWAAEGLISEEQARSILHAEGVRKATPPTPPSPDKPERGPNVVALFSYAGAFVALIGLIVFAGTKWDQMADGARALVLGLFSAALLVSGQYLRLRTTYRLGGNLLFVLGVACVPLTIAAIATAAGARTSGDEDFPAAATVVAISIVLTAGLVVAARVPMAGLVPGGLVVALAGILAAWANGETNSSDAVWSAIAVSGVLVMGAGVSLSSMKERDYALWVGLAGQASLYLGATALALDHWSIGAATAYSLVFAAVLLMSILFQNRIFLITAIVGLYTSAFRLSGDVTCGPALPLTWAIIGISLIILAIFYQRARREWLPALP